MAPLHVYYKGVGAMAVEFAPDGAFQIEEVRLHLAAVGGAAEDFTATLDSIEGSEYDVVLDTQDMNAETDELYEPTRPKPFRKDEVIDFAWTNTNGILWGLEIVYQLL